MRFVDQLVGLATTKTTCSNAPFYTDRKCWRHIFDMHCIWLV